MPRSVVGRIYHLCRTVLDKLFILRIHISFILYLYDDDDDVLVPRQKLRFLGHQISLMSDRLSERLIEYIEYVTLFHHVQ